MKKLTILWCLFLAACSNNNQSTPNPETPTEEVYNLDVNGIGFFSGSPLAENSPKVDLQTVVQGQKKSLSITIKNMGSTATALLTASLSDTKFYITSSTCSNKSLPPNGGSCSLTLNFSAVNKALQPFESNLNFGSSSIPVRIEVVSSSGQGGGGGSALIKMYDGATQIVSPPDYLIGSVSGTAKISKVITIKNEGTAATLVSDATLSSSAFYLSSNGCVGKALVVNGSCSVTVNFSGSAKVAGQTYLTNLNFAGSQNSLAAAVASPPAPPPAQLVFMDGASILSQDLHLGPYSSNVTLSKTLSVKNIGGGPSSTLSLQLLNNSSGYFTVSNSCNNIILAAGSSCSFSLRVSTSNKPVGFHSVQLKMDQTTQLVDFEKQSSGQEIITYQPAYEAYGACSAASACDGMGSKTRTYSCAKFINGVPSGNGLPTDCSPVDLTISCPSPAGDKTVSIDHGSQITTCAEGQSSGSISISCDTDFHQNGLSCVVDTYSVSSISSYSPSIPISQIPCDGTVTSTRSIIECRRDHDSLLVDNSKCVDLDATVVSESPAGNKNVFISNGEETYSCAQGSSIENFVTRTCNEDFHDNGSFCEEDIFIASFSSYSPEIPTNLVACDGTVTSTRTISDCQRQHNLQSAPLSKCTDPTPIVSTFSPEGSVNNPISNGTETFSCAEGSNTQTFVSRNCDTNYSNTGSSCTPTISLLTVDTSQESVCALTALGKLSCWGGNVWGQLGTNSTTTSTIPVEPVNTGVLSGKTIKQVTTGIHNTCVVASDDLPYCWGSNLQGSLGNGSNTQSNVPVAVTTSGVLSGKTIKKIAGAIQANCVIASDDKAYCWGRGTEGELGNGASSNSFTPVAVLTSGVLSGKTLVDIQSSGGGSSSSTCVKSSDNNVYCWGDNTFGQLCGGGGFSNSPRLSAASGTGVLAGKTISGFSLISLRLYVFTTDGKAYGCGANNQGQLGINSSSNTSTLTEVSNINLGSNTIKKIVSRGNSSCLLASDNKVYCY